MSDERIDLTQFEGKEGMADSIRPLIVVKDTECIAEDNNRIYTDTNYPEGDENRYGWIVATMERSFEYDDDIEGSKKLRDTYAKLFAMAPDLIAELKRCYEEIDRLRRVTNVLDEYGVAAKLLNEVDPHSE